MIYPLVHAIYSRLSTEESVQMWAMIYPHLHAIYIQLFPEESV